MLSDFPLVTICIPAYNHEKYIRLALDSVLVDSYSAKEIIIINDGSTDLTHQEIESWISTNSENININYINRENKGICETLNELITLSSGKYLVLLASDDYLLQDSIVKRVEYLELNSNKLAVFGDAIVVNENNEIIYRSALEGLYKVDTAKYFNDSSLRQQIITRWAVPGPVLMVNKDIYKELGVYNVKLMIEDWDFYLRMVSKNLVGFIPAKVSAYRVHEKNFSRKTGVACVMYKQMIKIALYNFSLFTFKAKLELSFAILKNVGSLLINGVLLRCR